MFREAVIWMLAVLTSVVGSALVFLLMQRQRDARMQRLEHQARKRAALEREQLLLEEAAKTDRRAEASARKKSRRHDPVADEADDELLIPQDAASLPRICPECGSRYEFSVRRCSRDQNELSAVN